jgi:hypothetical protein
MNEAVIQIKMAETIGRRFMTVLSSMEDLLSMF